MWQPYGNHTRTRITRQQCSQKQRSVVEMKADYHVPTKDHPACTKCGMFDRCATPFIQGFSFKDGEGIVSMVPEHEPKEGWIVVVGHYPSTDADEAGNLWVKGDEIRILYRLMKQAGIEHRLFYIPAFRCRPNTVNQDTGELELEKLGKPELKRCFTNFVKPFIDQMNVQALIGMGPLGTHATIGRLDYWNLVGRAYRYGEKEIPVYAAWHRDHIRINPNRLAEEWVLQLESIVEKIKNESFAKQEHINREYVLAMRPEQIIEWFDPVRKSKWPVSWDTETRGLQKFRNGFRVGIFSFDHPKQDLPLIVVTNFADAKQMFERECPDLVSAGVTWDQQRKKLEDELQKILEDPTISKIGHNCVDDQTEVLTPSGWVKFPDLKDGQDVMQWENGKLSFVTPSHVVRKPYSGPLHIYDSWFHQGAYTPDHRMVVSRIKRRPGSTSLSGWSFKTAQEVSRWHPNASYIPIGGLFEGRGLNVPDSWLRLAEAVRADGNIEKGSRIRFKFRRERKFIQLITLLNEVDQVFSTSHRGGTWRVYLKKPDSDAVSFILRLFEKKKAFGPWVWEMTAHEKEVWLIEALVWDGSSGHGTNGTLFSADPSENSWFQIMAHTSGYRYPHRQRDNARGFNAGKTHRKFLAHSAAITKTTTTKTGSHGVSHYCGTVYCVTVPSGAFLTRRNGVVNVTGNCQFDENAVYAAYKWEVKGFVGDTIMWQWALNPDESGFLGLESLVRLYFPDIPEYWRELEQWKEQNAEALGDAVNDYTSIPEKIILPYAAYDTRVVTRLFKKIFKLVGEAESGLFVKRSDPESAVWTDSVVETYTLQEYLMNVRKLHHELCTDLERTGQCVDLDLIERIYAHYTKEVADLEEELAKDPQLADFEKNVLPSVISKSSKQAKALRRGETDIRINWGSVAQQRAFFINYLKLPVIKLTDKKAPCLDELVIGSYATAEWFVGEDGQKIMRDPDQPIPEGEEVWRCDVAQKLQSWRKADKFVKSFLLPITERRVVHDDNLLHAQYRSNGIATGRLGVRDPNVQAIPRDGLIKKLYRSHHKDGWVVTRDYSGIEVRILALFCQDPLLLKTFREGGDVHFLTQSHFFGKEADKKNKTQRSICKQALFGNIYGQGDQGLFDLLTENRVINPKTGKPVTLDECREFNQMIYELYPHVGKWVKDSHEFGIEYKWVASAFGFVRRLPEFQDHSHYQNILNTKSAKERRRDQFFRVLGAKISQAKRRAQNTSIQSTAADFTVIAAHRINAEYRARGLGSRIFNVIHDDIWTSVRSRDEVEETLAIKAWYMDNAKEWMPEYLPGFDSSWITIPIIGEADVGLNARDCFPAVEWHDLSGKGNLLLEVPTDSGKVKKDFTKDFAEIHEMLKLQRLVVA